MKIFCLQLQVKNWTVRTEHGTTDSFQIRKGVHQGCILSPCLFTLHADYIMRNARLDEAHAGIKIVRRNINKLRCRWHHPYDRKQNELTRLLMKVKEENEKVGLKLNIQKTKVMASNPITSGPMDGEITETVKDLILLGSKITAVGDWNHEIKQCLLLGKKLMINLDSILKNRDITLPTKVRLVRVMVFPVIMYGCESWTVRKLSDKELMLLNCGVGEDSWESLGMQGDPTSPS